MEHQFKIGDRVRVITSRPADFATSPIWTASMDRYAGEDGYIDSVSLNPERVSVRFKDGNIWKYKPSWLTPVPTEETPLLKVGDRVRLLCDTPCHSAGSILTIDRVDLNDPQLPYRVGGWRVTKDCVELANQIPIRSVSISIPCIDRIKSFLGVNSPKETAAKLPLISKTKLLPTIKLD